MDAYRQHRVKWIDTNATSHEAYDSILIRMNICVKVTMHFNVPTHQDIKYAQDTDDLATYMRVIQ
jgi:hypothetical protein